MGAPEIQLDLAPGSDAQAVIDAIIAQYPQLELLLPRCALALNGEYAPGMAAALSEGDEVALLPPMSGG